MLIERRAFSVPFGHISDAADAVIAVERDETVILIFNDIVVDVKTDDTKLDVIRHWNDRRLASVARITATA